MPNSNLKEIENLFIFQDINKRAKLAAETEEQLEQVEKIEKQIEDKFKELHVPCED